MSETFNFVTELLGTIMVAAGKFGAFALIVLWIINEENRTDEHLFLLCVAVYMFASGLYYRGERKK